MLKIMAAQPNITRGDRIHMLSVSCLTSALSRSYPTVGEYKGGRHDMETSSLKKIQGTAGKRAMNPSLRLYQLLAVGRLKNERLKVFEQHMNEHSHNHKVYTAWTY